MTRIGIVGISGYSGVTVLELLLRHPKVCVTYVSANNTQGAVADIWPHLKTLTPLVCSTFNSDTCIAQCDVVFLAVPHTVSMKITPSLLRAKKRVIDLSADYRLKKAAEFKQWYGTRHTDAKNLSQAVYGLPELYREHIRKAALIANPGCYPTAALLGLAPLVAANELKPESIIIDAKSGASGAGKKAAAALMFCAVNENFKAYKVLTHQHTPEINQYLSQLAETPVAVTFVPHLLPVNRGILETIYVTLKKPLSNAQITTLYRKFYKTEPFVRVLTNAAQPELKHVVNTNFCDIGLAVNTGKNTAVITVAIDNLLKGAAGQAVQNMNIMCGYPEREGLV